MMTTTTATPLRHYRYYLLRHGVRQEIIGARATDDRAAIGSARRWADTRRIEGQAGYHVLVYESTRDGTLRRVHEMAL